MLAEDPCVTMHDLINLLYSKDPRKMGTPNHPRHSKRTERARMVGTVVVEPLLTSVEAVATSLGV